MGFFDDLVGGIVGAVNAPVSVVTGFFDTFDPTSAASDIAHAVVAAAQFGYQALVGFATIVSSGFLTLGQNILTAIDEANSTIMGAISNVSEWILDTVQGVFEFMTDWVNSIYTGFKDSIETAMAKINSHVQQFAEGVTDKASKLLAVNVMMAVVKHDSEAGSIGLGTFKRAAVGGVGSYIGMEILKGFMGL